MTKIKDLAAAFLQRSQQKISSPTPSPVPAHGVINAFQSLFAVQELSDQESLAIERILVEGAEPEALGEVNQDIVEVKRLTKELIAIKRQEVVLIGERIAAVREVFKKYKERSFREWMEFTFGSFKTGYNYLSFYDFYYSVPEDVKIRLKDMPARAVYILASKKVPVEQKIALVKEHSQKRGGDLIALIQRAFGKEGGKQSRSLHVNDQAIFFMKQQAARILRDCLSEEQRQDLLHFIDSLKKIIIKSI